MAGTNNTHLDIDFVRGCFPTFNESLAAKTAFFENAGGSYVAGPVLDKLLHFYRMNKVQPYGANEIQHSAGEQMDAGRQAMADLLGVDTNTITLGASTTQNFNTLAIACAGFIDKNAEVIVTEQDHESNIGAWERLCLRSGAKLIIWPIDPVTSELELDTLKNLISPATKLVSMTHSSNIVGSINPVEAVITLAGPAGIRVVVDGVSFAPHQWPDIPALAPDAYCFSTYKTYATHLGVMYTAPEFAESLDPQCHFFNEGYLTKRLDGAGPDHASIAALDGLREYFAQSHDHHFESSTLTLHDKAMRVSELMHHHENELCHQLLNGIKELPVQILGRDTTEGREANIALTSTKHSSAFLANALAEKDIAVGHGHFYALRLLQKAGIKNTEDGVLRISMSHYNNTLDVERLVSALQAVH